jgi:hypothetical protein
MKTLAENPVLGTWKLKSAVREVVATGEKFNQYGEHPSGYLSYSADGRMYAIGTSDSRVKPGNANPVDGERVKLHQTIAYRAQRLIRGDGHVAARRMGANTDWRAHAAC